MMNKHVFYRMTTKKKNKSKHKKKKGNFDNADDSLRILLQDEALVYCKMENYEKAIRQYTAVNIFLPHQNLSRFKITFIP